MGHPAGENEKREQPKEFGVGNPGPLSAEIYHGS